MEEEVGALISEAIEEGMYAQKKELGSWAEMASWYLSRLKGEKFPVQPTGVVRRVIGILTQRVVPVAPQNSSLTKKTFKK